MSVVAFMRGEGKDNSGRTIEKILAQDDAWLEREHDHIQWLFPLCEESQQVHDAPVLTPEDVVRIQDDPVTRDNHANALVRMTAFYLENDHWLVPMDHNHLRITRILKSVRLIQSLTVAERFYDLIMERVHAAGNPVNAKNIAYWTDAVGLSYGSK